LKSKEILDKALDLLTEKNIANGEKWVNARLLAFSAIYGVIGHRTTVENAEVALEIAEEWEV
jgi:hypothetical protein